MAPSNAKHERASGEAAGGLADLFRRHAVELIGHIRNKVGEGPPDADDIAQQAFAQFAALPAAKRADIDNPRAFLFRTASNLVVDHYRSASSRTTTEMGRQDPENFISERDELTPEIVLLAKERYRVVSETVAALPRRRRRFFLLSRIKGWSYRKIAKQNGVGMSTVSRDVEMALAACRAALEAFEKECR